MMTSIVSNDEPSMVEEDVESDNNDDLQILIGQTLALSRLSSNFGNIMNEVRPSKKATTQLKIYFENESEKREDIFTKVIFHTTRNRTKVGIRLLVAMMVVVARALRLQDIQIKGFVFNYFLIGFNSHIVLKRLI
jgi:hypothetical protein